MLSLVLYASADHLVTLDCVGGMPVDGQCAAERAELAVWGRYLHLEPSVRHRLMQETRDRTLRCYATSTMVDVPPNGTVPIKLICLFIYLFIYLFTVRRQHSVAHKREFHQFDLLSISKRKQIKDDQ